LHVGQHFASASQVLDAAQIKRFASEFDPQPFHLDEDAAKATMFGGLAASGSSSPRAECSLYARA
jgi:acyl dehydratase